MDQLSIDDSIKNTQNKTWIFVIVILSLILILIILFLAIMFLRRRQQEKLRESDDVLVHLSTETETPMRFIRNAMMYDKNVSLLSANQISAEIVYDANGIDKTDIDRLEYNIFDFTNYKHHYIQGFTELASGNDYMALKLTTARPLNFPVTINGVNGNLCHVCAYERLVDKKQFYFIQMTQTYGGYLKANSYKAISELLMYIKANYPGEYIIVGDFNVQGHERVFEHHLGRRDYHICDFYKLITCNDNEGIASPDGLVVSKKLYDEVRYFVDIYPGHSYQHFLVGAHMYVKSPSVTVGKKTIDITSDKMLRLFETIEQVGNRTNLRNNEGVFDSDKSEMLGDVKNITRVQPPSFKGVVYTNKSLNKKLALIGGAVTAEPK